MVVPAVGGLSGQKAQGNVRIRNKKDGYLSYPDIKPDIMSGYAGAAD